MKHIFFKLASLIVLASFLFSCGSRRQKAVLQHPEITRVQSDSVVAPVLPADSPLTSASPANARTAESLEKPVYRVNLPEVPREFRAAWVATVANINWPSKNNLSTEAQKKEAIALLDLLKNNNFNAVIFQVRPSADALYDSKLEPWSAFLTGETGKAPNPYYDPLAFWVEQAHLRGMELHVWINPYRAHHSGGGRVSSASMVHKKSKDVVKLRNGMYWFDPAKQSTQDHASAVVMDIVKRYDIDGVHFDDYFYPYASYNGGADFPDTDSWNSYRRAGGKLSRADWRRASVNTFIKRIYQEIKKEKPFVKFGLSPFGIWKSGYPAGITGSSQYDELYADAKLWLNEGWVDYFTPQLYWPIDPPKQSFTSLLKWWQSENTHQRHLWPGLNTVAVRAPNRATEINRQIEETRRIVPQSKGEVHWSIAGLTRNPTLLKSLREGLYAQKALVPASPWLPSNPLLKPSLLLTKEANGYYVKWLHQQSEQVFHWVVYFRYGENWEYQILEASSSAIRLTGQKGGKRLTGVAVRAVDRLGNLGDYMAERVD